LVKTYHTSDIEILIATMNRSNFEFLQSMFLFSGFYNFNILIVNQTTKDTILKSDLDTIKVINVFEKGLSKNRNLALQNATKPLILLTDDDVVFELNFELKVIKAFNENVEHDGFRFQFLNGKGNLAKKYPREFQSKLSKLQILNTSSIELVFKRESVLNKALLFDVDFGLGTIFNMGEEAIFVSDAIKKGLKIGFVPEEIVSHLHISTGNRVLLSKQYFVQSAVFYRIFGKIYLFWIALKFIFDVKQKKTVWFKFIKYFNQAIKGKKAYVNHTKL